MSSYLSSQPITKLLNDLYSDAKSVSEEMKRGNQSYHSSTSEERFEKSKNAYMAVGPECGKLLHNLIIANQSQNIIEFGTSFGISTLFMASALKELGSGKIITTEYFKEKADKAKHNLTSVNLESFVELRVGDARETLSSNLPEVIDLVFLDGAKPLYLEILKLLEPRLKKGSIVVSDNVNHNGMEDHLHYIRSPENSYISTTIGTQSEKGFGHHEFSIRI